MPAGYEEDEDENHEDDFDFGWSGQAPQAEAAVAVGEERPRQKWRQRAYGEGEDELLEFGGENEDVGLLTSDLAERFRLAVLQGEVAEVERCLSERIELADQPLSGLEMGLPLAVALRMGRAGAAKALLDRGRARMASDADGFTPLMTLCCCSTAQEEEELLGCAEVMLELRPEELKVNQRQCQLMSALMLAAKNGRPKLTR